MSLPYKTPGLIAEEQKAVDSAFKIFFERRNNPKKLSKKEKEEIADLKRRLDEIML